MNGEREIQLAKLTEEIVDQIIFGMENQEKNYKYDLIKGDIITVNELRDRGEEDDTERYVKLPQWRPVDGFYLMERFVAYIKNPIYRQEMRDALNGGRGVFRRFKDVLKRYDPLEKQWFSFKEKEMRDIVRNWYGAINDSMELSRLGEEPEETENLVLSDFVIKGGFGEWREKIVQAATTALRESLDEVSVTLKKFLLQTETAGTQDSDHIEVLHAETPVGEFAGCIVGVYNDTGYNTLLDIRYIWIEPLYRGLGLSRLFIDRMTELASEKGIVEAVIELLGNTLFLRSELEERGFREFGRRYSLHLDSYTLGGTREEDES
ncbi:MAG: UPF0158 family protein [Sediminispirochaetaceae bacterium]